jgi:hypothetical protein
MEQVGDMKFIDFEDALDRDLGKFENRSPACKLQVGL